MVILQPGAPATEEEAKPYVQLLGDYLGEKTGGSAFSASFFGELAPGVTYVQDKKPAYGFISYGVYKAHQKSWSLVPLAQLKFGGRTSGTYSIVVRKGRYQSLGELKGKRIAGGILFEPDLFYEVALAGKYSEGDFELIPTTRTMRVMRKVAKDKMDAIVLDQRAVKGLAKLKLPAELAPIHETAPVPNPIFVAFGGRAPGAEQEKVKAALLSLCTDPKGMKVCRNFDFDAFVAIDAKDLEPAK